MSVMMVQSTIRAENSDDVEAGFRKIFAAIEKAQPGGVRYASCRLNDGTTYVGLLQLDDGIENPLPQIPEFAQFLADLKEKGWQATSPTVEPLTVVGSYGLFEHHS
jgi:hypothetical protein